MNAFLRKITVLFLAAELFVNSAGLAGIMPFENETVQAASEKAEFFVDPSGKDTAAGTIDEPLKTPEGAKAAVRRYKAQAGDRFEGATVYFREGTYSVPEGFKLEEEDSGTKDGYVTYSAYNNEKVNITNSVKLDSSKFTAVTDPSVLKRIPAEAAAHIKQLVLSDAGITDFGTMERSGRKAAEISSRMLYVDGKHRNLARYPNGGYIKIDGSTKENEVIIKDRRIKRWTTAEDPWAYGCFYWEWSDDGLKITDIEPKSGILTVDRPTYGIRAGKGYFRVYNLLEELDSPDEWFLDTLSGILYLYAGGSLLNQDIRLVTSESSLVTLNNASFIKFSGITFEGSRGTAFEINNSNDNIVTNCVIRNIGKRAADVTGKRNGFEYCHIYDIGMGGIRFNRAAEEDLQNLVPAENYAENCHFERVDIYTATYAGAVMLSGVGDRVSHCRINMSAMTGITFNDGVNNVIEYNDVYDIMKRTNDQGVFYGGRYWTRPGNVIRKNSIHDCTGIYTVEEALKTGWLIQGIYLDDGHAGQIIDGNVFSNMARGVFLHHGRNNTITNNLFVNCAYSISIRNYNGRTDEEAIAFNQSMMGDVKKIGVQKFLNEHIDDNNGDIIVRYENDYWNIRNKPAGALWDKQFPYLKDLLISNPYHPQDNVVTNNIILGGKDIELTGIAKEKMTYENNYYSPEVPELVNEKDGNYNPKDESVYGNVQGFEKLDITETGIEGESNLKTGDFALMSPLNGAEEIEANNAVLSWEHSSGADSYRLIVAADSEFKNIVYNSIVKDNSKRLTNLRYGKQKYYWKVEASSSSHAYTGTVPDSNGVFSFRTKASETVDKTDFKEFIAESEKQLEAAVEGERPGEFLSGAKEHFAAKLDEAKKFVARNDVSGRNFAKEFSRFTNELQYFLSFKNPEEVNAGTLIADKSSWSGLGENAVISGNSITVRGGAFPRYSKALGNHQTIRLKATYDFGAEKMGWSSIGLRTSSTLSANPWSLNNYIFIVKKDTLELQAYNNGFKWLKELKNDYITENKECEIEFAALNCEQGVRVTVTIDGVTVYDVVDDTDALNEPGYFGIFHPVTDGSITVSAAD